MPIVKRKKIAINFLSVDSDKMYGPNQYIKSLFFNWSFDGDVIVFYRKGVDVSGILGDKSKSFILNECPPLSNNVFRVLYEQVVLPFKVFGCDLLFTPNNVAPILVVLFKRAVIVIYDLLPFKSNNRYGLIKRIYLKSFTRMTAKLASKILTISNTSANDIFVTLNVPVSKIRVIACGVFNQKFIPSFCKAPYFITVSGLNKDKRIQNAIRAFALYLKSSKNAELYILGGDQGYEKELKNIVAQLNINTSVKFMGFVTDETKYSLMSGAQALFMFGLNEGFGLPVIEAMRVGCPVIVSNTGSLPEIGGDAALVVDPEDEISVVSAMRHVVSNREIISTKSINHSKFYSGESVSDSFLRFINDEV